MTTIDPSGSRPAKEPLRVVIVDDHELFSAGLEVILNNASTEVRVVGSTADAGQALELVRRLRPHLAIIDLAMPPPGGVEAIRMVRHSYPSVRVLALSGTEDLGFVLSALKAGANGFLLKASSPEVLVPPLLSLASGVAILPQPVLEALVRAGDRPGQDALAKLTDDEQTLWRLVARGCENVEIAEQLFASERTVKRMVATLLRKIGASNRLEAAALAGRSGLLDDVLEAGGPR